MTCKKSPPFLQSFRKGLLQRGPWDRVSPPGTNLATKLLPQDSLRAQVWAPQGCRAPKPTTPPHYFHNTSDYLLRFKHVSIVVHFHSNMFSLVICRENPSGYNIPIWNLAVVTGNLKIEKPFWIFQLHFAFDIALGMPAAHSELPLSLTLTISLHYFWN